MKNVFKIGVLMTLLLTVLVGCKKKETEPVDTKGGLVFEVIDVGIDEYAEGAIIGMSTSQSNLDNAVYFREGYTGANGRWNVGDLTPGTYFWDCYYNEGVLDYYTEGTLTIERGVNLTYSIEVDPQ